MYQQSEMLEKEKKPLESLSKITGLLMHRLKKNLQHLKSRHVQNFFSLFLSYQYKCDRLQPFVRFDKHLLVKSIFTKTL